MAKNGKSPGSASAARHSHQQRSNVHNPNNAAHRAAADNRSNQQNPNRLDTPPPPSVVRDAEGSGR